MALFRQTLCSAALVNIPAAVNSALAGLSGFSDFSGKRIALAVGSRGIDALADVLLHTIKFLRSHGASPFIVPAMGSHGNANPEGQKSVLESLGISESAMGVEIRISMDTIHLDKLEQGLPIFLSKEALDADYMVPINRIKAHTKFSAPIESGLIKMLTIGLGKAKGARLYHRQAVTNGFGILADAAQKILDTGKVLFGLALVEDGYGRLAKIEAVPPNRFIEKEAFLLQWAKTHMAKIPLDLLDLLIVDIIGKDISGIGMDSNVTGRHRDIVGDFFTAPHVKRIFVRNLSAASEGNANGIGLADVTTTRLVRAIDTEKTYMNAITAISPEKAAIPIHFDTDRKALSVCADILGMDRLCDARVVRIRDTAHLEYFQASQALAREIAENSDVDQVTPWKPMVFDDSDNLQGNWYGGYR